MYHTAITINTPYFNGIRSTMIESSLLSDQRSTTKPPRLDGFVEGAKSQMHIPKWAQSLQNSTDRGERRAKLALLNLSE